jgi:predicted enzyme related to lactoylglutathione lyase
VPQPVVHFEVIGKDPKRLRRYFGELFGWQFDVPSPVAHEVSEPASYGFLDLVTSDDGSGIRGGVGGERGTQVTPSSTLASRMWRLRCSAPRTSEACG